MDDEPSMDPQSIISSPNNYFPLALMSYFSCTYSSSTQAIQDLATSFYQVFVRLISCPRMKFAYLMIDGVRFCVHSIVE